MAEEFLEDILSNIPEETKTESEVIAELEDVGKVEAAEKSDDVGQSMGAEGGPDLAGNDQEGEEGSGDNADVKAVEELAQQLGWNPEHTGEDAVDAKTYILRSKDIQKSMSKHNKDLKDQLHALNGSVEALKQHNDSVYKAELKRLEGEVAALKKERREAIELADVDKVEELDKQIDEIQKDINKPKETDKQKTEAVENPAYDAWIVDNKWYLEDDEMAKFADSVAGQYVGAPPERIYTLVRQKVQEVFPEKFDSAKPESEVKDVNKNPVGPKSPVESSSAKVPGKGFTEADLTQDQLQIMNQFVRSGIMTKEQYINDIAKLQDA